MKAMRLLLLLATTWVVSLSRKPAWKKTAQPYTPLKDGMRSLTSQYRTKKAYGNLQDIVYLKLPVCEEENNEIEIVALSVIMPGNAAFRNGTWATQHGLVDMEIATDQTFSNVITTNYGWNTTAPKGQSNSYMPMNQVRFKYNNTVDPTKRVKMVYIRLKSFRASTTVVLEATFEKEDVATHSNAPTPFRYDKKVFPQLNESPKFEEMVQYAQTKDPNLFVSGDDFIYFSVRFCNSGITPGSWMTATAVGLDKLTESDGQPAPTQAALNIILCEPMSGVPIGEYCINPGIPAVIDHEFSASPVVSMRTPVNLFDIQNFIIGVQGQGGYRTEEPPNDEYNRGRNDFTLALQVGST